MKTIGDVLGTRWLAVALLCACLIIAPGLSFATTSGPVKQLDQLPMDSPGRGEVLWYDDLESGATGWTHGDFTTVPPKFHKDTYMAYAGTYSWWCGNFDYDTDGGYGNSWDQKLVIPDIDLSLFVDYPILTYCYRADSEVGYDRTFVQVEISGVTMVLNGPVGYEGVHPWTDLGVNGYNLNGADDPLKISFRFISDGGWSDEDGIYLSVGGAFMCDNIKVYDWATGIGSHIFFDTVETGSADSCIPTGPPVGGDHWHLGTSLCHASSGEHYWACTSVDTPGFVPAGVANWLMTPMVDISGITPEMGLKFHFGKQFFVPHEMGDSWKEEYTLDGGATWHLRGHWWGDQYEFYGRGPCVMNEYFTEVSDTLLPGTQAAMRWTMYTDSYGCGPDAIGLAGIMLDDIWLETTAGTSQVWNVPDVIPTIQEAVNLASGTDTVYVAPGTYAETVAIPPEFGGCSLIGESGSKASVLVTGGMTLADGLTGATIKGLHLQGVGASSSIIRSLGTVTDLTIDDCVIDGEYVSGRLGHSGGQLEGDLTVVNCEMKEVLGWALFDSKSGSGGDGSALGTITFADNYVHNCNGSIAFRGLSTDRTDVANVYDNVFEDIGGNNGEQGQHWAALEINHCVVANVYNNSVDGVTEGEWTEGQAFQLWDIGTLNFHHNLVTNNHQGVYFFAGSAGSPYGGPYAVPGGSMEYNCFTGNTQYGVSVDAGCTGGPLNAEMNWWGDASGPATSKGTGDKALGDIDYDPWIGKDPGGENITCAPDPLVLSGGTPTGIISVDYAGGGAALIKGYSLKFSWDGGVASTATASVTEGDFSSGVTSFFDVRDSGTNQITIDCAILNGAGVAGGGTLFTVEFEGQVVDYSTCSLTLFDLDFRDVNNDPVAGIYDDDGEIVVDRVGPSISDVVLINYTLAHTDAYVKDTDDIGVLATVWDEHPGFGMILIRADATGLGSGGSQPPNSHAGGTHVAWWLFSSVTCSPSDGTVTVIISCTDPLGNVGTPDSGTIIADNTAPGAITGFDASPAHEEVVLIWDDPSGLDTYQYGVVVRYDAWGDYPFYATAAPAYPASHTAGNGEAFDALGAPTGVTHAIAARAIYYYTAFAYDWALNYGPPDATARSTNYWLGDVVNVASSWVPDGLVTVADFDQLAGTYAVVDPAGNSAECNVGPTDDHSRVGIPLPHDGGVAVVDFEDLMIFSMNYGVVSPRVVPLLGDPCEGELALSIEEVGRTESTVEMALVLSGNAGELKGTSVTVSFAGLRLESARLSDEMYSALADVFFWHGVEENRVTVDLAVLGTGITIGGSGELARFTFTPVADEYTVEFSDAKLRGVENDDLTADLEGLESGDELPTVFRLVQNVPNPFNPVTKVAYHVPSESRVTIRVFDVTGRLVTTLVDGVVEAGRHAAIWNGTNDRGESVGSGVYFCTMETPDYSSSHKMTLLK